MQTAAYFKTLAAVAVTLFLLLPKNSGFALALAVPVFAAWVLYNVARIALKPPERRNRGLRLATWGGVLILVASTQVYWVKASRGHADAAVAAILLHHSRTGHYPASLREAGLDEEALRADWNIVYRPRDSVPDLNYPITYIPLSTYEYDFQANKWKANVY